jgi:hypothetical protein
VRLRRAGAAALAVIAGIGILVLVVVVFGSRDRSTVDRAGGPGQAFADQGSRRLQPGTPHAGFQYNSDPPTSGPHVVAPVTRDDIELDTDRLLTALEAGDVVLVYGDRSLRAKLRALQNDIAGPFDPEVALAGQAVVLSHSPRLAGSGVIALAWRHMLRVSSPSDPALREFVEFWLGRGAGGG